jgi:CheY-like chemotaxis protein
MVEVRLSEERYAPLRPSSLYESGPHTVRRGTTPQPVLTSYKRLEIARMVYDVVLPARLEEDLMNDVKTILIIEDEPLLLEHVVDVLSECGYRVLPASTTAEALHYLTDRTCQIDLMFADIRIPGGMNGLALAREVQTWRPGLPVILTTGFASELLENPAPQVFDILSKPYTPDDLLTTIRKALEQVSSSMPRRKGGHDAGD